MIILLIIIKIILATIVVIVEIILTTNNYHFNERYWQQNRFVDQSILVTTLSFINKNIFSEKIVIIANNYSVDSYFVTVKMFNDEHILP